MCLLCPVDMEDVSASPSHSPSPVVYPSHSPSPVPPQPPSTTTSAASKGKARAEAPTSASSAAPPAASSAAPPAASSAAPPAASSVTPPSSHYNLRGKKRPADTLAEKQLNSTEEDTPRKSGGAAATDVPRVQVDAASPPLPTHPVLIDLGVKIATQEVCFFAASVVYGCSSFVQDRCGPCIKAMRDECKSQGSTKRLTTACQFCHDKKKTCDKPASWALAMLEALYGVSQSY
jgi:hypothetical protein